MPSNEANTCTSESSRSLRSSPFGRRGEIIGDGGDGTTASPEAHMKANPLDGIVNPPVLPPVSLPLARELARVARGRVSPELATLNAQLAEWIIAEHDRREPVAA